MTGGSNNVEKCVNCEYYDRRRARPTDGKAPMWGQCRRHSPLLNPATAKAYVVEGAWPLVRDDDWCGQWQAQRKVDVNTTTATMLVQAGAKPAQPVRPSSPASAGPRTLPMHGGAAAIAAGYKPTPGKAKT